jgi:hypothetical protein
MMSFGRRWTMPLQRCKPPAELRNVAKDQKIANIASMLDITSLTLLDTLIGPAQPCDLDESSLDDEDSSDDSE